MTAEQKLLNLKDWRPTRRELLKVGAAAAGSFVLADAVTGFNGARAIGRATSNLLTGSFGRTGEVAAAGPVVDVPTGWLSFQKEYPDDVIERTVLADTAVPGANAIMADKRASQFGIPVRILDQIPGQGKTKISFLYKRQVSQSETTPDCLVLPKRPLKNWWPADNLNLPETHVIRQTMLRAQRGAEWINDLLLENGIEDALLEPYRNIDIRYITDVENSDDMACSRKASGGLVCKAQFVFPGRIADSIRGANGGDITIGGKNFVYADFQTPLRYSIILYKTLHELTHTGQERFPFIEQYYVRDSQNPPSRAVEVFTDALAMKAIEERYQPFEKDPDRLKALQNLSSPGRHHYAINWFNNITSVFSLKTKQDGTKILLEYGARGDMVGLQDKYDSLFGKGQFAKTL